MKAFLLVLSATILLLISSVAASINPMEPEFLTGFESGIFLRDSKDLDSYGCPEPSEGGPFSGLDHIFITARAMTIFLHKEEVQEKLDTI